MWLLHPSSYKAIAVSLVHKVVAVPSAGVSFLVERMKPSKKFESNYKRLFLNNIIFLMFFFSLLLN